MNVWQKHWDSHFTSSGNIFWQLKVYRQARVVIVRGSLDTQAELVNGWHWVLMSNKCLSNRQGYIFVKHLSEHLPNITEMHMPNIVAKCQTFAIYKCFTNSLQMCHTCLSETFAKHLQSHTFFKIVIFFHLS